MKDLLTDIKFAERFFEKYFNLKKNFLAGKVSIKEILDKEIIFLVDDKEVSVSIKK